ncbi:MAG: sulfatase-like hydrolase/transferase [Acidobacteriota bacterium]
MMSRLRLALALGVLLLLILLGLCLWMIYGHGGPGSTSRDENLRTGGTHPDSSALLHQLVPPFDHSGGHLYVAKMPPDWPSDSSEERELSAVRLCENGKELGPAHAPHAAIAAKGGGQFSHWNGNLYFSTGDNTDPNSNGRTYAAELERLMGIEELAFRPRVGSNVFEELDRIRRETARAASFKKPRPAGRPRLVYWFTIDAQRADVCGSRSNGTPIMPALEEFRRESVTFSNAYAQGGFTKISVASMFTGLWPGRHGVMGGYIATPNRTASGDNALRVFSLDPRFCTLPELMADSGYETWTHEFTVHVEPGDGMLQGFDHLDLKTDGSDPLGEVPPFLFVYEHILGGHAPYDPSPLARDLLALKPPSRIDPSSTGWFTDTIDRAQAEELRAAYLGDLNDADRIFAKTMTWIRSKGLWDDAMVIVTSDHGEAFLEHGSKQHDSTLYEEIVRVPLSIRFPKSCRFSSRHGSTVKHRVRLIDLYPTILYLVSGSGPPYGIDGRSLGPILDGSETDPLERDVLMRQAHVRELEGSAGRSPSLLVCDAVISGTLKAQMGYRNQTSSNVGEPLYRRGEWYAELYDLAADPHELCNIIRDRPDDFRRLAALALDSTAPLAFRRGAAGLSGQELARDLLEELRSLGYAD